MLSFGEIRVYLLDDLLRRLGKDCEVCVYGPAKRRFLNYECRKCIERAERLVNSIVPDQNYIQNPEKLDKWLVETPVTAVGKILPTSFMNSILCSSKARSKLSKA